MKDSLQQVLQKLVLLKDPSPDVDGRFFINHLNVSLLCHVSLLVRFPILQGFFRNLAQNLVLKVS